MAVALTRENFFLHKLHSLTGVVPVGYYMAQHLLLNSYSLAGPAYFDGVINFFDSIPRYLLFTLELVAIWIPLAFHAVYGLFIYGRAKPNFVGTRYVWSQNRMFTYQRWTGVFLFFALILHVCTTTGAKYFNNNSELIKYAQWHEKLLSHFGIWLIFYLLLVLAASYHLGYGIWNFCIRWGITVSDRSQVVVQKLSFGVFVLLTLLGWGALAGFIFPLNSSANAITSSSVNATIQLSR
jgi:succinate dehydrogenase / fumarate reductase cytochrome b subunit